MKVTVTPSLSWSVSALCAFHNINNNINNNNPFCSASSSSSSNSNSNINSINNMNNPLSPANLLASRLHMTRTLSSSVTDTDTEHNNNDCTSSIMTSSTSTDSLLSSVYIDSCVSELCHIVPPLQEQYKRIYLIRHGQTEWNVQNKIQGNTYDIDLNTNGIYQAQIVGTVLSSLPDYNKINLIVSSNLERAEQTANIITRTIQDKQKLMSYNNTSSSRSSQSSVSEVSPLWRSSSSSSTSNGRQHQQNTKLYPIKRVLMNKFSEMKFGKEFDGLSLQNKHNTKVKKYYVYEQLMKKFPSMKYPQGGESIYDVQQRGIVGIQQIINDFPNSSHIVIVSHGRFNKILLSMITSNGNNDTNNNNVQQQQTSSTAEIEQDNCCINIIDIHETDLTQCKLHVLNYNEHLNEWQ